MYFDIIALNPGSFARLCLFPGQCSYWLIFAFSLKNHRLPYLPTQYNTPCMYCQQGPPY